MEQNMCNAFWSTSLNNNRQKKALFSIAGHLKTFYVYETHNK